MNYSDQIVIQIYHIIGGKVLGGFHEGKILLIDISCRNKYNQDICQRLCKTSS